MPQGQAVNPLVQLFPLVFIFIIFYFLLIRPKKKEETERQKMIAGINKNDEIVTLSGIHATVVNIKDKTLVVRIDENCKMEIEKNSVGFVKKA